MTRERRSTRFGVAFLVIAPQVFTGCGVLLAHGPPADHEQLVAFTCTKDKVLPSLDAAWGALNLLGALGVASEPDRYTNSQQAIATGVGWGLISLISAAVGFDKVNRCIAATQELEARRKKRGAAAEQAALDVQTVVITPEADTIHSGDTVQLVASAYALSGKLLALARFKWSSSNDAIASVSLSGLVTAHDKGAVVIAANSNGVAGVTHIVVLAGSGSP